MINIPDKLCDDRFEEGIKSGCVIRTLLHCRDGIDRSHYFITLSYDVKIDPLIFVVATSQLNFYSKYPHFNRDILRISANELPYFPKETVIDCRKIHKFQKEKLKQNFRKNILEFVGEIPTKYLSRLHEIIRESYFISKKDKMLILEETGQP